MHSAAEITEGLPHWQGIPRCWETPPKGLLKFINQRRQKMQPQQPFTDRGFLGLRLETAKFERGYLQLGNFYEELSLGQILA
jgi:hypothetical protein